MSNIQFDTLDFEVLINRFYADLRSQNIDEKSQSFPMTWLRWQDRHWINEFSIEELREQIKEDVHRAPRVRHFGGANLQDLVTNFKNLEAVQFEKLESGHVVYLPESCFVPIVSGRSKDLVGVLYFPANYNIQQLAQIQTSIEAWRIPLDLSLEHWTALHLSLTDDVTGLFNQRYLPQVLNQEIMRAQRTKEQFSVLFIDMDHFKKVNDHNGHLTGSKLLQQMSLLMKKCVRAYDYCFRYGGDEFLVVLTNCPQDVAEQAAERIRSAVEKTTFIADKQKLNLTVSIGVATYPQHAQTSEQLIRMADEAMYDGKNSSRNVVFVASAS